MEQLLLLIKQTRSSVGFWRNIVIALVLAAVAIAVDVSGLFSGNVPKFLLNDLDQARSVLISLAGTYLTITTFTFSSILSVLSAYISNYTPRVTENFLSNASTLRVLGIFVGGFFYAIITLFALNAVAAGARVVSSTVLIAYSLVTIANFVHFIFTSSRSLQTSRLVADVVDDAQASIDRCLRDHKGRVRIDRVDASAYRHSVSLRFESHGFLDLISLDRLLGLVKDHDGMLVLLPIEGDFLSENQIVARFMSRSPIDEEQEEALSKAVNACMHVDANKAVHEDYRFSVEKLTEIALRGVSPGVNDPNTAIHCLNYIGVLTGRIASVACNYTRLEPEAAGKTGSCAVVYPDFVLENDLDRFYASIVTYAAGDLAVMYALFASLASARRVATTSNHQVIDRFALYCLKRCEAEHTHIHDRVALVRAFTPFGTVLDEAKELMGADVWDEASRREDELGVVSHRQSARERSQEDASGQKQAESEEENSGS